MGFEDLSAAVHQAIATRRIGVPVAARVVAQTVQNAEDVPTLMARIASACCVWMNSRPVTLWASGDLHGGHWTALLRFAGGQTALASAGTQVSEFPIAEVTVFGNHGSICCEGGHATDRDSANSPASESDRQFLAAVRLAIQTRQAVELSSTGPAAIASSKAHSATPSFDLFVKQTRHPLPPPYGLLLVAGDHTHQPNYTEALLTDPRCRLVGLTDDSNDHARRALNDRLASRLQTRVFPDFLEAVNRPDIHIVSICAEPERRAPLIIAAANAGRHLYLDKPLCASVAEAAEIVSAVRSNRVLAHMFTQVLWDPAARVRRLLDSGELGELKAIHCDLCFAKGHIGTAELGQPRRESRAPQSFELPDAKREMTNIGVYCVVLLLWLLRKNVRRIFAATGNYFFQEHQSRDMEDFGQMLLEMDGGITASITAGRTGWQSHRGGGIHRVCLVGSRRTVTVDAFRPRVEICSDSVGWTPPLRDPDDPLSMWAPLPGSPFQAQPKSDWIPLSNNQWSTDTRRFLDSLEQGKEAEVTVELAAAATEILSAAYESAATQSVVPLPFRSA